MKRIVTLTLNPAIDAAAEAEVVRPIRKIRTWGERYDPGGGGINVARVIQELGGQVLAVYLVGGITGAALEQMVRASGIEARRIPIVGHTRMSHTVHERSSGLEYRFVPQCAFRERRPLIPAHGDHLFQAMATSVARGA